jgi:hypothetical protein
MNRALLLVVLFCGLAAAFRNHEEFQTVLPGMWQGTATSLLGTTRTVQFVFTSDGHYSCHVITEDTAEIDDWSGESCFEEGTDYDSPLKTYSFNYDVDNNFISGSVNLVDYDGMQMLSEVDLVVTTHVLEEDQLFFRVKSPRSRRLHTFFTLKKIASEEEISPCQDYCQGEGYCYFYSGACSNDVIYDSWSMDSSSSEDGGICLFTIIIIAAVLTCLCCCCCRMCRRRRCHGCKSMCRSSYRCNYTPVPQEPQVPSEPYPGFYYTAFIPQGPSAPMYVPLNEGTPAHMPPPYVVVPMMAPEN